MLLGLTDGAEGDDAVLVVVPELSLYFSVPRTVADGPVRMVTGNLTELFVLAVVSALPVSPC